MTADPEAAAVLGVERSVLGKRWRPRLTDERAALAISQRLGLPEIVGRVLGARDVDPEEAEAYLNPTLRHYLPDPSVLKDMDVAAERLARAIAAGEKVAVFGDYDVDGATSSAVLSRFFEAVGAEIRVYIPDRIKEGYGPSGPAMRQLAEEGTAVVITVDCGITSHAALAEAEAAGLEVIVVDHHVAEPQLPPALAVVNPNRLDEDVGLKQLAAVGVTYLLVIALNRHLRDSGRFADRAAPELLDWLDLVALGTVCDAVPLTGLNRAIVAQGLKVMAGRRNKGIAALADVAGVREPPGTFHAGFLLGPRVNAGGRVGEAGLGARLLSTDDAGEAERLAAQLDGYNRERRAIEEEVQREALERAQAMELGPSAPAVVAGEGWHPGVIGIVASRLVERLGRPCFVVAVNDGVGKGSGRSVAGVDLGSAVIAARQAGLLVNGGGHRMAAGLTVEADRIAELSGFLAERIADQVGDTGFAPSIGIDGGLTIAAADEALYELLQQVGPYGNGHPEPRFVLSNVRVAHADVVGTDHVRCRLTDEVGGRLGGIAFRSADGPLGKALLGARGGVLHLAGYLRRNEWRGRTEMQFLINDAARP